MKSTYAAMLIVVLFLGAGCSGFNLKTNSTEKAPVISDLPKGQITIFVDQDCPHCKTIENWVEQKKAGRKLPIVFKEIFNDRVNAALMIDAAKHCNIPLEIAGVPLLWDGQQCRSTDEQILKYLEELAKSTS